MATHMWILAFCVVACFSVVTSQSETDKNSSEHSSTSRNGRYFADSRLPIYQDRFYDTPEAYPKFQSGYEQKKNYEIPTSFDQFVPDQSSGYKYSYPGAYFLPYSSPDRVSETSTPSTVEKTTTSPSIHSKTSPSFLKNLVQKVVSFFTGDNDIDSSEVEITRPSLLTSIQQLFKDPVVGFLIVAVPLGFLLASLMTSFVNSSVISPIFPEVTSSIAGSVARTLDTPEFAEILDTIAEFSAKAIEDPKCFQRHICQAAKRHIEGRSGSFWAAQKAILKLSRSVNEKLWDTLGLNMLFKSLQSGHCNNLQCSRSINFMPHKFMDKLQSFLTKVFKLTEIVS